MSNIERTQSRKIVIKAAKACNIMRKRQKMTDERRKLKMERTLSVIQRELRDVERNIRDAKRIQKIREKLATALHKIREQKLSKAA